MRLRSGRCIEPTRKKQRQRNRKPPLLPIEVILIVARYLPRSDLNKLKLGCKRLKQAIDDPQIITQPWATNCPFRGLPIRPLAVIFSNDGSRVAVLYTGQIQVWDRDKGLVGSCSVFNNLSWKPAFSPDNQLLLLEALYPDLGFRVCQLEHGEIVVHYCPTISGADVHYYCGTTTGAVFIDNSSIAFMEDSDFGVHTCNVTRANGQIALTEHAHTTPTVAAQSGGVHAPSPFRYGRLAYFSGANKDVLAMVNIARDRSVFLYDRRTKASVSRLLPAGEDKDRIVDLAFSPNGNLVVVQTFGLSVFDCSVDIVSEIGERKDISFRRECEGNISFSPMGYVVGSFYHMIPSDPSVRDSHVGVIDINENTSTATVLTYSWIDPYWKLLVAPFDSYHYMALQDATLALERSQHREDDDADTRSTSDDDAGNDDNYSDDSEEDEDYHPENGEEDYSLGQEGGRNHLNEV